MRSSPFCPVCRLTGGYPETRFSSANSDRGFLAASINGINLVPGCQAAIDPHINRKLNEAPFIPATNLGSC
jgi:hypothetical protein